MILEDFLELLPGRLTGPNSRGWLNGKCPAHEDKSPSFGVKAGETGLLVKCQAGCTADAIAGALGIDVRDLFYGETPISSRPIRERLRLEAEYVYPDADGTVRLLKQRFRSPDGTKTFAWVHRNGSGSWETGKAEAPRRLYNLPAVLEAVRAGRAVLLVEGEKDADAATELGFAATTSPEAASVDAELLAPLRDADVVIVGDNDGPGRKYVLAAAKLLPRARVLALPGVAKKGDLSDWSALQAEPAVELRRLVDELRGGKTAPEPKGPALPQFFTAEQELRERKPLGPPFNTGLPGLNRLLRGGLRQGQLVVLVGPPSGGKTTFAAWLAYRWMKAGGYVAIYAKDEGPGGIVNRFAQLAGHDKTRLLDHDADECLHAAETLADLSDRHVFLNPYAPGANLEALEAVATARAGERPVLALIDSIQVVEVETNRRDAAPRERAGSVISSLRAWSSTRSALILALSQSNRAAWRDRKTATDPLSAAAESAAIEHGADVLLWLPKVDRDGVDVVRSMSQEKARAVLKGKVNYCINPDTAEVFELDGASVHDEEDARDAERLRKKTAEDAEKVIAKLKTNPAGLSRNQLRDAAGLNSARVTAAVDELQRQGRIFGEESTRRGGGWHWRMATVSGEGATGKVEA